MTLGDPPSTRSFPRWLRVAAVLLALGLVLAWWLRDAPRRLVRAELAKALGAESLELGGLRIEAKDRFRLRNLEASGLRDYPAVGRVAIAEIEVEADLGALLKRQMRSLRLHGLEVDLLPGRPLLPPAGQAEALLVESLIADDGRLRLCADDACEAAAELVAHARLSSDAQGFHGTAGAAADVLPLAPLAPWLTPYLAAAASLRGELRGLHVAAEIDSLEGRLLLDGGEVQLPDLASLDLRFGRLEAGLTHALPDGGAAVSATLADLGLAASPGRLHLGSTTMLIVPGEAEQRLTLESATLRAALDLRGETLDGRLELPDLAAFQPAEGLPALTGSAELALAGSIASPSFVLETSPAARITLADWRLALPRAAGTFVVAESRLQLADAELRVDGGPGLPPGLLPLHASATLDLRPEGEVFALTGRASVRAADLPPVELEGGGRLDPAAPERAKVDLAFRADGLPLARLAGLAELPPETPQLAGRLSARGRYQGALSSGQNQHGPDGDPPPALEATIQLREGRIGDLADALTVDLPLVWRGGEARASGARAQASLQVWPKPLPVVFGGDLTLWPDLGASPPSWKRLTLAGGEIRAGGPGASLGGATLRAELRNSPGGAVGEGRVDLGDLDLSRLAGELGGTLPPALADYAVQGRLGAGIDLELAPGPEVALRGEWQAKSAGFTHRDGSRVLEGLAIAGPLAGSWRAGRLQASVAGRSGGFQILWDTLFADFSDASVALSAELDAASADDWTLEARVEPLDGPRVDLQWQEHGDHQTYRADLLAEQLDAIQSRYIGPLFGAAGGLEVGGSARAAAAGRIDAAGWTSRGRLALEGKLATAMVQAAGIELDVPFDLRATRDPAGSLVVDGERQRGRLAFASATLRGLTFPAAEAAVWTAGDDAGFDEDLHVDLAGGQIALERLRLSDLLGEMPVLEMGAAIRGVLLEELTALFALPPLEGRVDGQLPRVALAGNRLEVDGGGRIALFGGEVELGDISGEDLISPYPRLRISARFREIDLGRVTRRFEFGEMQGVVEGFVEDAELFRGLPLAFHAQVRSVDRKGVRQTVDVKAIENLTVLGTGSQGDVLSKGIGRFFRRFYYSELGIEATLKNDALLLRGLAHRGSTELFLKGRLPLPIDVVNAQPGKTVSFQTMVRRLQRLNLGAAQTGPPP